MSIRHLKTLPCMQALTPVRVDEIESWGDPQQPLPPDYYQVLIELGFGTIGDGWLQLYSGPVPPSDLLDDEQVALLGQTVFIGDDGQGNLLGYTRTNEWQLVEYISATGELEEAAESLSSYLEELVADLAL